MEMQRLHQLLALVLATVLPTALFAQAATNTKYVEVHYATFQIYQQADSTMPGMRAIDEPFTYAIVRNPDASVSIDGGTIEDQKRLLSSRDMKRCVKRPSHFDLMLGSRQQYEQLVAAQRNDPNFFKKLPNAGPLLQVAKNLLAFNADAKGLPIYHCYTDAWRVYSSAPIVQDEGHVPKLCYRVVDAMIACNEARANSTIRYTPDGRSKLAKSTEGLRDLRAKLPSMVAPSNIDEFTQSCKTAWREKAVGFSDPIIQELTAAKDTKHADQCKSAISSIK